MSHIRRLVLLASVAVPVLLSAYGAAAAGEVPVSLELVIALDTSVSIDEREFALQVGGVANAFRDTAVIAAIRDAGANGIAVSVVQWGVGLQQAVTVDWVRIRDRASAEAFARSVESSPRHFFGNGTSITRAIGFAARQFAGNGFAGQRRIIDVSGDGRNNSGAHPSGMRDRVVSKGIIINGLPILDGDVGLGAYFAEHVIGGAASFALTANNFEDFADAFRMKLLREITIPMALLEDGTAAGARIADRRGARGHRTSKAYPLLSLDVRE